MKIAPDATPNQIRAACRRSVARHGGRSPAQRLRDLLDEVDEDERTDIYGQGPIIADFEAEVADLLGKEAAVFVPSGTMAQQMALRVWTEQASNPGVGYHPTSHLHLHEQQDSLLQSEPCNFQRGVASMDLCQKLKTHHLEGGLRMCLKAFYDRTHLLQQKIRQITST